MVCIHCSIAVVSISIKLTRFMKFCKTTDQYVYTIAGKYNLISHYSRVPSIVRHRRPTLKNVLRNLAVVIVQIVNDF